MAENDRCLIIFAKEPVPGQVKNRLSSTLGQQRTVSLYKAFLQDMHTLADVIPVRLRVLAYESFGQIPNYLYSTFPHFIFYPQHGPDLGARMADAVLYAKHLGAKRVVIIGSDSPTLPPQLITESFERLKNYDAVLGPCLDGGFYLLGLRADLCEDVFENVAGRGKRALSQIRKNVRDKELSAFTLCDWYDIDGVDDLTDMMSRTFSSIAASTNAALREIGKEIFD